MTTLTLFIQTHDDKLPNDHFWGVRDDISINAVDMLTTLGYTPTTKSGTKGTLIKTTGDRQYRSALYESVSKDLRKLTYELNRLESHTGDLFLNDDANPSYREEYEAKKRVLLDYIDFFIEILSYLNLRSEVSLQPAYHVYVCWQ